MNAEDRVNYQAAEARLRTLLQSLDAKVRP